VNEMHEHDFDEILKNTMPELPPEDIVRKTVPWRTAMNHILTGFALCTLTLQFLALHYILPTIGMILLVLGFRSLRSENSWFRLCWVITILHVNLHYFTLILNATIYQNAFYTSPYNGILRIVNVISQIILYICFWRGIAAVQRRAGTAVHARSALALLIWYFALLGLALLQYQGWILAAAMVTCFILVIHSLYRLSHELDESGYALKTTPVRISDNSLKSVLVAVLLAGIACGYIFGSSYHMDWQKEEISQSTEMADIKEKLLSLGYPEAALNDLSDEDILMCKNASIVTVEENDNAVNDSRDAYKVIDNPVTNTGTVYDLKELHTTSVMVELGDGSSRWRIFHHFLWTADPGFHGTEALEIWPAYHQWEELSSSNNLTGRLLYDNGNDTYVSSYHSLKEESYITDNIMPGKKSQNAILASFSFPHDSKRQRGYVAYGMEANAAETYQLCLRSMMNYVHQNSILQYPVKTAISYRKHPCDSDIFTTVQNGIMFEMTVTKLEPSSSK